MIRMLMALLLVVAAGCNRDSRNNSWEWDMDPRLERLALWAYDCMLDVAGLAAGNTLPVPNVQGVDEPWGERVVGTFYHASRHIRVQITRPESHVVDIILHEMGHDADWRVNGKYTGEDYATWVNQQCRENVRPAIYPAPRIDW